MLVITNTQAKCKLWLLPLAGFKSTGTQSPELEGVSQDSSVYVMFNLKSPALTCCPVQIGPLCMIAVWEVLGQFPAQLRDPLQCVWCLLEDIYIQESLPLAGSPFYCWITLSFNWVKTCLPCNLTNDPRFSLQDLYSSSQFSGLYVGL